MRESDPTLWWAALGAVALLGLLVGSFLNVVIWRVPRGESVVRPPSACPGCGQAISARDNIPVLSWVLLRGRCRGCAEPISLRYPLVEAGTAALFVGVALRFDLTGSLPAFLYLAAICVALLLIDIDVRRLPDAIVLPAYVVLPVLLMLAAWVGEDWGSLLRAGIGGAGLYAFYFVAMAMYPGGMGFGDVKLAGVLGMALGWVGWGALVVGAFGAFLLGGVFSIVLLVLRRADRKSGIPFGPWMIVGTALGIGCGEALWSAYLGLM
ncbi:prepilin peptidase [Sanguibacter sp. 25GB23B1]|uniref:prepilin peptidase n=1 Tax=unclassified Sanguibacter TaxID=2645534 RepID=UPI0032AF9FDE